MDVVIWRQGRTREVFSRSSRIRLRKKGVRCRIYELGGGVPVGVAAAGDSRLVAGLESAAAAAAAASGPAVGAGVVAG
jgi:hypothetical protein